MAENKTLENMLNTISEKLGADSEKLKQAVQSGNPNEILKNIGSEEAKKVEQLLSNKEATSKFLLSGKAQQLFKKLMGGK